MSKYPSMRRLCAAILSVLLVECAGALTGARSQDRAARPALTEVQARAAGAVADETGVCVHLAYLRTPYGEFDTIIRPRLLESGIRHLRDGAPTRAPGFGRETEYQKRLRQLAGDGFSFSLLIADEYDPKLMATDLSRLTDVYEWSGRAVDFFENANEPNLNGAHPDWVGGNRDRQRALYEAVHSNPNLSSVAVLGPGLAGGGAGVRMLGDISPFVDYGNWHTYSGGNYPEAPSGGGTLPFFKQAASVVYPGKQLVITETGYHSALKNPPGKHPPTPEPIVARYLPRLILWNLSQDIRRTYIYELLDTHPPNDADQEANFGLLRHDGTPKPSFYAVKHLLELFADRLPPRFAPGKLAFGIAGDTQNLKTLAFQKSNGRILLAVWLGVPAWNSVSRTNLPVDARHVSLALPPGIKRVSIHAFSDDGDVAKSEEMVPDSGLKLSVSDHLTVLEF
jgi:hypothetical protein